MQPEKYSGNAERCQLAGLCEPGVRLHITYDYWMEQVQHLNKTLFLPFADFLSVKKPSIF